MVKRVLFIIYGEEAWIITESGMTLRQAKLLALKQTRNTGRPDDEWETRLDTGARLSEELLVQDLIGAMSSVRLFLSLKIGFGG